MEAANDVKVYVAIIAGVISLVVSLIALLKSIRITTMNSESAKEIEEIKALNLVNLEVLKIKYDKRERSIELASIETTELCGQVNDIWRHLQKIKESIDLIGSPVIGRRQKSLTNISKSDTAINEIYSSIGGSLPEDIKQVIHDLKNMTRSFSASLNVTEEVSGGGSNIDDFVSFLKIYRENFTSFQDSLKERKEEYIERKADEIYRRLIENE